MAKGLRSSKGKANRAKLRCKVFGPVEDARTQRLSVKLLEVASRPRSKAHEDVRSEETENTSTTSEEKPSVVMAQTSMSEQKKRIDHPAASTPAPRVSTSRVHKRKKDKTRVAVAFPCFGKSKRLGRNKLQ